MKKVINKVRKHLYMWQGKFVPNEIYNHSYLGKVTYLSAHRDGFCLVLPHNTKAKNKNIAVLTKEPLLYL